MKLDLNTEFEAAHGTAVNVAPGIRRLTVNNPGPFTFKGTNSYLVGTDSLALIDPGPEDDAHFAALMRAIDGRPLTHIFVSHTHRDHSPLTGRIKAATGAVVLAEGPHRPARDLRIGEINPLDASADTEFQPDVLLADNTVTDGDSWSLRTLHTPGHTANHCIFALEGTGIVFSADHVMAWATSIVAPPDGAMTDYMASLNRMLERDDQIFLPGHGGPVRSPRRFMRGLKTHRRMRERAIVERLRKGDRTIADMVSKIYSDTDPRLHGAAGLSVLAHLEDLVGRGIVATAQDTAIDAEFQIS